MKNYLLVAGLAMLASLPAMAQRGVPPPGSMGPGGPHGFGREFHDRKLVTGAPYTATVTNTIVQQLAGGNSIQRTTTGQVARDSAGRTYEQQTITGGPLAQNGPKTITFITDPVAGYSYVLDSVHKTAFRHPLRIRDTNGAPNGLPEGPNPRWKHADSSAVETDLPADSSSGILAQGKSKTHTIPAGVIGNAQPIVSTSEIWTSFDLDIVVKAVRNDPRFGQSTYALTNIVMKEPDASLFQIPAGYTVKEGPLHGPHEGSPQQP
ncbi:MAG: hypothetical protein M3Y57_23625 [Acidobacteriota bacterium]|nr:hypothetical protein [Acidobacteriota bacterium]